MDFIGGNAGEEWSSLCGLFNTEEAEFVAQLLGFPSSDQTEMGGDSKFGGAPTSFFPGHESGTSSESSFGLLSDSNSSMEMELLVVDDAANTTSTYLNIDVDGCSSQGTSDDNVRPKAQEKSIEVPELPKKRSRW